jgi:hypothetical protein
VSAFCRHKQNPVTCLACWKERPVGPDPRPDPAELGTQVVHVPCGCRLSVNFRTGEVVSWQQCGAGHDARPQQFWAQHRERPGLVMHALAERAECDAESCREAARRVDRARTQYVPWSRRTKPGFGQEG